MLNGLIDSAFPIAAAMAIVAGLVRGFAGFGSAMLLVPSLSALYGPQVAIPMLGVMELAVGGQLLPKAAKSAEPHTVGYLSAGALLGIPLGAVLLVLVPAEPMRWAISTLILVAVGLLVFGVGRKGPARRNGTVLTGGLSGLTAGATGMGGPPVVIYFLAGTDAAASIRATLICFFLFTTVWQGTVYIANDLLTWEIAARGALLYPGFALGAVAGSRLFTGSKEQTYRRVALVLVAAVAVVSVLV
ncbi:sulfite exporter TauE/SafE family protein [Rhodovibrio salinarum]|uniref:Probable membrane transporter protein n=1 Tax=Rhodovibrio salinarum TaxID=1087 RepID=A0A934QGR0_9PROT|nr:sulfite exporter TauE/SafE family protein [Rhodovibrio salinarum]MBK1696483.1 sulfite exporter TauE/SafE family protein [Rhodovibrio salinarum]